MKKTEHRRTLRALAATAALAAALTTVPGATAYAQQSPPQTPAEIAALSARLQAAYPSTRFELLAGVDGAGGAQRRA